MDLNVVYLSVTEGTPPHSYWDHGFLDEYLFPQFKHVVHELDHLTEELQGAVVVLPARAQAESVEKINRELSKLKWCIVMLTGDEESVFPWRELKHPRMLVWVMSPKKGIHDDAANRMGSGYRKEAPEILKKIGQVDKVHDWSFSGQVTHDKRKQCVEELKKIDGNGYLRETKGFGQGAEYEEYLDIMAHSKFVMCPSGPVSPDSFRLYEALEAGCIPIADSGDYWSYLFDEPVPFPVLTDWSKLPETFPTLLTNYQALANRVFAWWQLYKRKMADTLQAHVRLCGEEAERVTDNMTVLMPTNPIPSNPSTEVIEQTLASVVEQVPNSEILVMIDGLKPEMSEAKEAYEGYIKRLLFLLKYKYPHCTPVLFDTYSHQSLMTRVALKYVHTPLLLFVEHDTPVVREIDWAGIKALVGSGYAYQVRLSHEGRILPDHEYLMLDQKPTLVLNVPLIRTKQWSQRPHVASTEFYRTIIEKYHDDQPRFIEHVMYGKVLHGEWSEFRTHIYAPPGDIQRTIHLDGRKYGK